MFIPPVLSNTLHSVDIKIASKLETSMKENFEYEKHFKAILKGNICTEYKLSFMTECRLGIQQQISLALKRNPRKQQRAKLECRSTSGERRTFYQIFSVMVHPRNLSDNATTGNAYRRTSGATSRGTARMAPTKNHAVNGEPIGNIVKYR